LQYYILSTLVLFGLLSACGGSSDAVASANQAVTQAHTTLVGDADSVAGTLSNGVVTGFSAVNISNTANISVIQNISDSSVTSFTLSNASGTATFNEATGDTINEVSQNGILVLSARSASADALMVAMPNSGFGVYMAASSPSNAFGASTYAGHAGISSFSPTGTATYQGGVVGLYATTGSSPVFTIADMTAAANFGTNTISLTTTGTVGINPATGAFLGNYGALNISATNLVDGNGNNHFIGNISDGSGLSGSAEIALFGLSAQEVAGIGSLADNLNNPTKVHLISFGGDK